ncbi:hypothetical protein KJ596_01980 [Patescibacteria group bacterium]|nr:hypothetical protein [Patescibacteria group bacterium]MBU1867996.1 hypothetical protein [Patescibacteria group bacterium]
MKGVQIVNKNIGETPLQAVDRFRLKFPLHAKEKISYAGRLDPMASGALLLLVGKENKNRKQYEKLDKEYIFEVLFGVATDSGDILGLITETANGVDICRSEVEDALQLIRARKYQYPPQYSSVRVKSKPLYYWARKELIGKITIPKREVKIYSIELVRVGCILVKKLERVVPRRISLVKGDFRQDKILSGWKQYFASPPLSSLRVARIKVTCGSGTYVRSIATDLGKILKIPSLTLNIKRTKILFP